MLRVLLTTTSGIGHLHPLVPLARAAAAAGHHVAVAAPASLAEALAARELPHVPLPDYGPGHLARAMRQALETTRPDLVLHEAAELSGPMAAEEAGAPHATVAMALRGTVARWTPVMAEGAADLAVAMGLSADVEGRRVLDAPFATLAPPSLEEPGTALPATVLRYRLTDVHPAGPSMPLEGPGPLVWVTLGTEAWRVPGVAGRIVPVLSETAAAMPAVRFLLTTGSGDVRLPSMPANVEVAGYVPQEQVLRVCDAVLGHGGFNTTMAALSHGRPLVLTPLFSTDQFKTADRVDAVEAGIAVTHPDPVRLRHALDRALTDPAVAAAAARLAAEMAEALSPGDVIDLLLSSAAAPAGSMA